MPGLKTGTREENLVTQLRQVTAQRITKSISPINPVNGFLLVRLRLCARHGKLRPQGRYLVKEIWT